MEWSGIAMFYFGCLVFGFLGALLGFVFGEFGGHFHIGGAEHGINVDHGIGGDHGLDAYGSGDHGMGSVEHGVDGGGVGHSNAMPGANIFNTITITTFIGFFGISGLAAVWLFKTGALLSLVVALPAALIVAIIEFILFVKIFIRSQASSEATLSEILGCEACVTASIPAERVGQITYVIKGSRFTAPAMSSDGQDISRGARVVIVNIRGVTLVVRPM